MFDTSKDKNDTVCMLSSDAQFLIKEFRKVLKNPESSLELKLQFLSTLSKKIKTIQKKAQKIENRCKAYRYAIESLGFVRKETKHGKEK